ncbi:MAG TPA: glycoside hydrolase family 16 protein [Microbacterium sp.]|uniref:glycoside hydrolase family 16 protein n=1 Tax=Microbacterium sp. TaxID=51671 RepID=UPI002BFFE37D|nr:glycoside hydrolase family 16 protein [Microbacterium sp.]HWI31436.1 glycoside hydrolase family 16 protein [Microbacterium sp.]
MTVTAPPQADPADAPPSTPRRPSRRRRWLTLGIPAGILVVVLVVGAVWWFTGFSFIGPRYNDSSLLFDDFDGPAGAAPDRNVWSVQTGGGGWGNDELQEYTEDAVALNGEGSLVITATVPRDGSTPTSGRLTTQGKWSFGFGRLSARIKLPEGQGLLPAFWLLGDKVTTVGWPAAGEIDIIETPNTTSRSTHHLHGPSGRTGKWALNEGIDLPVSLSDDFHVYTVEKRPGRVIIAIDDQVVMDVEEWDVPLPGRWVFDDPTHALFSLAVGGNWPGDPDATTPVVNEMVIDWLSFEPADHIGDTPLGTSPEGAGAQ